jgi:signal transduction histidine kinase
LEPIGSRWAPKDLYVSTRVLWTGGSARVDETDLDAIGGADADVLRLRGFLHQVGRPVIVEGRLWGAMTLNSKEALPEDVDQRLVSFTELVATAIANAESRAELAASRARIVATADATRRRIERNLHDGAQQHLVSLALELRAAQASLPSELGEQRAELSRVVEGLMAVLDELREISSGIHPAILSEGGLAPALKTLARRSPIPVLLDVHVDARLPESVEVAAYYVVSEMLTNAAKHAHASSVHVQVAGADGVLHVSVRDDGVGGADPARGSGLVGLRDRVEALGGTVEVESPRDAGTAIEVALPFDPIGEAADGRQETPIAPPG